MFRILAAALAGASALTLAAAEAREIAVADAAALSRALDDARPGDALRLAPGAYGALALKRRSFAPSLTIAAADAAAPPIFQSALVVDVSGLVLDGITFARGRTATPLSTVAVEIRGGTDIELARLSVSSAANGVVGDDASGVLIRGASRVVLRDSRINDVFRGVVVFDASGVEIRRNIFRAIGVDGVAARGTVELSIVDNYFAEFKNVDPVRFHPDAIQLWSRFAARASENVVIRGNLIRRGSGDPAQGIFVKTPELPTESVLIEENVVEQSMGQGIAVLGAAGVVVRNNTVIPHDPRIDRPGIDVRAPVSDATISGNIMIAARIASGVAVADNEAAGFHHMDVAEFVAERIAVAAGRSHATDYLPTGAYGARAFVKDLWVGDAETTRSDAP